MPALALTQKIAWPSLRLTRRDVIRGTVAGTAWGMALTAGLTAMSAWQCGVICLSDVAVNAGLSVAAGLLGIGPLAAYGRR